MKHSLQNRGKGFRLSLLLTVTLLLSAPTVWAGSVVLDGLKFTDIGSGKASVAAAEPEQITGQVVIPSTVTIGGSEYTVTDIATQAFKNSGITSVFLPSTIESIGRDAFFRCLSLTGVILPENVVSIGYDAFYYCSSLEYIKVMDENPYLYNVGKAVVSRTLGDIVVAYPGKGDTSLTLPESIRGIGEGAFSGCQTLEEVFIPASVESVSSMTFLFCEHLRRVLWNATASAVPMGTFQGCEALEEVVLSRQVESIGGMAFYGTHLKSLTLLNPNPPTFYDNTFESQAYTECTVYVPEGSLAAYRSAEGWKSFAHIEEVQTGVWQRSLIVETRDGGTMEYLLDRRTKVRLEQPNLIIETEGTTLTYELDNLAQIRYGRKFITTGIHGEAIVNGQAFRMDDGVLFFDNLREGSLVEVYTVDGKAVMSRRCGGQAQLSLSQFPSGVFFVKVNGESYKILKK